MTQAIGRPFGVSVFGSAMLRTEPDGAEVGLGVTRLADAPRTAFDEAREAVTSVRAALRSVGVPDAHVAVERTTLESAYEHTMTTHVFRGYQARAALRVLVTDLDRLEEVLAAAVDAGANDIAGVSFQTTRLTELRAEARAAALEAARAKAEVYCRSAGVRLGRVVHIEDANPLALHVGSLHLAADSSALPEDGTGTFEPGSLIVTAAVHVGFALIAG